MPKKNRDYAAEYRRRQELARKRGFKSYGDQRRQMERGERPFIGVPRSRRSIEAAERGGLFVRLQSAAGQKEERIADAIAWSKAYSRHASTEFDEARARRDPDYLSTYYRAFVMTTNGNAANTRIFDGTEEQRHWFVDIQKYLEAEEFDVRYGESESGS